jgi:hypothetical protein
MAKAPVSRVEWDDVEHALARFGHRLPPMAHNGGLIPETGSGIERHLMPLRS